MVERLWFLNECRGYGLRPHTSSFELFDLGANDPVFVSLLFIPIFIRPNLEDFLRTNCTSKNKTKKTDQVESSSFPKRVSQHFYIVSFQSGSFAFNDILERCTSIRPFFLIVCVSLDLQYSLSSAFPSYWLWPE